MAALEEGLTDEILTPDTSILDTVRRKTLTAPQARIQRPEAGNYDAKNDSEILLLRPKDVADEDEVDWVVDHSTGTLSHCEGGLTTMIFPDVVEVPFQRSLMTLNLSFNQITTLDAAVLACLVQLRHLNVSHNLLERMDADGELLPCEKLETLDMSYNRIVRISGLERCARLQKLILSHNHIHYVSGLEHLHNLNTLHISDNALKTAKDVRLLSLNQNLVCVALGNNPLAEKTCYRPTLRSLLPNLRVVDAELLPGEKTRIAGADTGDQMKEMDAKGFRMPIKQQRELDAQRTKRHKLQRDALERKRVAELTAQRQAAKTTVAKTPSFLQQSKKMTKLSTPKYSRERKKLSSSTCIVFGHRVTKKASSASKTVYHTLQSLQSRRTFTSRDDTFTNVSNAATFINTNKDASLELDAAEVSGWLQEALAQEESLKEALQSNSSGACVDDLVIDRPYPKAVQRLLRSKSPDAQEITRVAALLNILRSEVLRRRTDNVRPFFHGVDEPYQESRRFLHDSKVHQYLVEKVMEKETLLEALKLLTKKLRTKAATADFEDCVKFLGTPTQNVKAEVAEEVLNNGPRKVEIEQLHEDIRSLHAGIQQLAQLAQARDPRANTLCDSLENDFLGGLWNTRPKADASPELASLDLLQGRNNDDAALEIGRLRMEAENGTKTTNEIDNGHGNGKEGTTGNLKEGGTENEDEMAQQEDQEDGEDETFEVVTPEDARDVGTEELPEHDREVDDEEDSSESEPASEESDQRIEDSAQSSDAESRMQRFRERLKQRRRSSSSSAADLPSNSTDDEDEKNAKVEDEAKYEESLAYEVSVMNSSNNDDEVDDVGAATNKSFRDDDRSCENGHGPHNDEENRDEENNYEEGHDDKNHEYEEMDYEDRDERGYDDVAKEHCDHDDDDDDGVQAKTIVDDTLPNTKNDADATQESNFDASSPVATQFEEALGKVSQHVEQRETSEDKAEDADAQRTPRDGAQLLDTDDSTEDEEKEKEEEPEASGRPDSAREKISERTSTYENEIGMDGHEDGSIVENTKRLPESSALEDALHGYSGKQEPEHGEEDERVEEEENKELEQDYNQPATADGKPGSDDGNEQDDHHSSKVRRVEVEEDLEGRADDGEQVAKHDAENDHPEESEETSDHEADEEDEGLAELREVDEPAEYEGDEDVKEEDYEDDYEDDYEEDYEDEFEVDEEDEERSSETPGDGGVQREESMNEDEERDSSLSESEDSTKHTKVWQQFFDYDYERYYFHNTESGETTWTRPEGLSDSDIEVIRESDTELDAASKDEYD